MENQLSKDDFYSVKQAADKLGCSIVTVYNMLHAGTIRSINLNKKCTLIPKAEIDRIWTDWLKVNPVPMSTIPITRNKE